jgi:hypothetical protein
MGKLSGKVAFVTGGASGIGRAIVGALTAEGADIGIVPAARAEITLIGTPLLAAKNGSVNGLVLKSMKPPASAALLSPGLAKKIVSTSNTAFSKQPLSFPTNQGAMSSATKCPALTFVKVMAVVDGPKAAIATSPLSI